MRMKGLRPRQEIFNSNKSSSTSKPDTKKVIQDYSNKTRNAKQASENEAITQFVIYHVGETYEYRDDIATSMKDLIPLTTDSWKPSLLLSTQADQAIKAAEDK
jgi:hypothetical protein